MLEELRRGEEKSQAEAAAARKNAQDADAAKACKEDDANEDEESGPFMSLLHQILLDDLPMTRGPSDADASAGTLMQDDGDGDEDRKDGGDTAQSYATALSRMPRLVYYETTAETVNAVQALVTAGEADAGNCCALIDKQEGVSFLESVLRRKPGLQAKRAQEQRVRDMKAEMNDMVYEEVHALTKGDRQRQERAKRKRQSLADALDERADDSSSSPAASASASPAASSEAKSHRVARSGEGGASHQPSAADSLDLLKESWTGDRLHIICSSVIYDELFRQVRQWAREGNSATSIQKELDLRFQDVITQSIEVRDTVAEVAAEIVAEEKEFLQKAKMEKARADAEKEAAAAAASAVISSDGESGGAESQEFAEGVGAAGDGGERLEGAPLVREESTVEKSAMATLAAKEQAEVLQSHTNKSGKKKK